MLPKGPQLFSEQTDLKKVSKKCHPSIPKFQNAPSRNCLKKMIEHQSQLTRWRCTHFLLFLTCWTRLVIIDRYASASAAYHWDQEFKPFWATWRRIELGDRLNITSNHGVTSKNPKFAKCCLKERGSNHIYWLFSTEIGRQIYITINWRCSCSLFFRIPLSRHQCCYLQNV